MCKKFDRSDKTPGEVADHFLKCSANTIIDDFLSKKRPKPTLEASENLGCFEILPPPSPARKCAKAEMVDKAQQLDERCNRICA